MKRDLKKAIADYERQFESKTNTTKGTFYRDDIIQLRDMSYGHKTVNETLCDAIMYSLKAGFMLGYRAGRRDGKAWKTTAKQTTP